MKFNKKTAAAVTLAAALACGTLAGCDLITSDTQKDMLQVVAEVDISRGKEFASGGAYEKYAQTIDVSNVLKRDLIASFLSSGYQYIQGGSSYSETFDIIKESLVNRKMLIQYAMVYLYEQGEYNAQGYEQAVAGKDDPTLAGLAYFLTEEERAKAEYDLKVIINNTIDSQEKSYITAEDREYDSDVRTTPTGIDSADAEYCDKAYKIYTGKNSPSDCGTYKAVEGSTPTTRKKAYNAFLANLEANNLLDKGEDVSKFENLNYYKLELQTAYEDAILEKLADGFEATAEATCTETYLNEKFQKTLDSQKEQFADKSAFETALDGASQSSFVLYAPNGNYGYVINILLPFSALQSNAIANDKGTEGQKFVRRAQMLQNVKATDQRKTWFTGETDRSYKAEAQEAYQGREYLFFEDSIKAEEGSKYKPLKNYFGKYAYNGTVEYDEKEKKYTVTPAEITVDDFIAELEGYLGFAGISASGSYYAQGAAGTGSAEEIKAAYYAQTAEDFYSDSEVDYSKFLYYQGKADIGVFNANDVFVAGSKINTAMSVVNELSFAYNTDTAGLNKYLGYSVSAYDTSFVKEFEFAAKAAVAGGVGTYTVAPSQYGWHIMYCTFSYGNQTPYTFDYADIDREGSFSNLYYEAVKSSTVDGYSAAMQTQVVNNYNACVTVYENRYADLKALGNKN